MNKGTVLKKEEEHTTGQVLLICLHFHHREYSISQVVSAAISRKDIVPLLLLTAHCDTKVQSLVCSLVCPMGQQSPTFPGYSTRNNLAVSRNLCPKAAVAASVLLYLTTRGRHRTDAIVDGSHLPTGAAKAEPMQPLHMATKEQ